MSLVNDMLRDLEQRNEKPAPVPGDRPSVKAAQYVEDEPRKQTRSASRIILWLIGAAAILMTAWLLWQDQQNQVNAWPIAPEVKGDEQVAETTVSEATVAEPLKVEPVQTAIPTPQQQEPVEPAIESLRWAGTDQGGDLVVSLNSAADIQVLSQSSDLIVVAFDGVSLKTALPKISSPLVERLDVTRENDRTLLSLTTPGPSQFAFRVQQQPAKLILGVLPDPVQQKQSLSAPEDAGTITQPDQPESPAQEPEDELPSVAEPDESDVSEVSAGTNKIYKASELQVSNASSKSSLTKPVTKAKSNLTDAQIAGRANRLLGQGKLEQAEQLLLKQVRQNPQSAVASRILLATLLLSKGELVEAESWVDQGLSIDQSDLSLRKLKARILLNKQQPDRMMALLQVDPPALEQDPEYHELLATAYQQNNRPEDAARIYYQLLQRDSQVPRWWVGMGLSLEQAKRYAEARKAYQSGLQIKTINASLKTYARQRVQALSGY